MHLRLTFWVSINLFTALIKIALGDAVLQCSNSELCLNSVPQKIQWPSCPIDMKHKSLYLLYDVNPSEGFNLRRDVYIRLAVFVRKLQHTKGFRNVHLVLPPWGRLYHWKSEHISQNRLPWSHFFNVESLQRYTPVLDYPEFLQKMPYSTGVSYIVPIHKIVLLKHFKDMFDNGVFYDKWQFTDDCHKDKDFLYGLYLKEAPLWFKESEVQCVHFQGSAKMLENVLIKVMQELDDNIIHKVIALVNSEIVLHDEWGSKQFWEARRSMRFAENLIQSANEYRLKYLHSSNNMDKVQRPPMWELEKASHRGKALGGPYIAAHLRRADFLYGRKSTTPSLKSAALQLKYYLQQFNLTRLYLATDASVSEVKNFKSYLPNIQIFRFNISNPQQSVFLKDGSLAIIDQLICAHARFFVGTYESTFTYRIYEEREILGFPSSMTFNTFCKISTMENCSKNTVWPIVY